jgi:hypothetical protein
VSILIAVLLFVFVFLISSTSQIPLEDINYVTYRKSSSSASLIVKLKNGRIRTLYILHIEDAEEKVNLFCDQGVFIKEKNFLFS